MDARTTQMVNKLRLIPGQNYDVGVKTSFDGAFKGFMEENGAIYAVFQQAGRTDRGGIPLRKVPLLNIVEANLIEEAEVISICKNVGKRSEDSQDTA